MRCESDRFPRVIRTPLKVDLMKFSTRVFQDDSCNGYRGQAGLEAFDSRRRYDPRRSHNIVCPRPENSESDVRLVVVGQGVAIRAQNGSLSMIGDNSTFDVEIA